MEEKDTIKKICDLADKLGEDLVENYIVIPELRKWRTESIISAISRINRVIVLALTKGLDLDDEEEDEDEVLKEAKEAYIATIKLIIEAALNAAELDERVMKEINLEALYEEAAIRRNFKEALTNTEDATELSWKLDFGFSDDDIRNLAKVHRDNRELRKKVEDLLTDCNFHEESRNFAKGDYDRYINSDTSTAQCRERKGIR